MVPGKEYIGVGCGGFILNDKEELLLQLRNKSPEKGCWSIPGGKVEKFETFKQAVKREIKEELDIEVDVGELISLCDHILVEEDSHWVSPSYLCTITKGTPKIMEPKKHLKLEWFSLENLPDNLAKTTKEATQEYKILKKKKEEEKCQVK